MISFLIAMITVSWQLNTEPDVAKYRVYWGEQTGYYTHYDSVDHPNNYINLPLDCDQKYYFVVSALDKYGNESAYSEEVSNFKQKNPPIAIFPNPSNSFTTIVYKVFTSGKTKLSIYNMLGQEIATLFDEYKGRGEHRIRFSTERLAAGIYFCYLYNSGGNDVQKILVVK